MRLLTEVGVSRVKRGLRRQVRRSLDFVLQAWSFLGGIWVVMTTSKAPRSITQLSGFVTERNITLIRDFVFIRFLSASGVSETQ